MLIKEIVTSQREFFLSNKTKSMEFRIKALKDLRAAIISYEKDIMDALNTDLGKSEVESYLTEISIVQSEIKYALKHLSKWMKPVKVPTPIAHFPSRSYILSEPLGTALVLSPWNYPFQLCLAPVVGAIAAGNTIMIKPSKSSSSTAQIIKKIIETTFDAHYIYCAGGDEYSYDEILTEKYDFIFFTGSENVGKTIMTAAAKHLTPVALELGGKSPCIVDSTADIALSARRIVWGKFLNAGQTCVAPDYLLVHQSVKQQLIDQLQKNIHEMYGINICQNQSYPKIINTHHLERLAHLIKNEPQKIGGTVDSSAQKIEPCLFTATTWNDEIMKDEIFGPILPIITYADLEEALAQLEKRPKPLALYLFTKNSAVEEKILREVSFGGGCINDVVIHLANHHLPFGGVGASGMGNYHGKYSFSCFSHQKGILKKGLWLDIPLRYQPFSQKALSRIKKIL